MSRLPLGSSVWALWTNQLEPGSFLYFQLRQRGVRAMQSLPSRWEQVTPTGLRSLVRQPQRLVWAPGFALHCRVVFFLFFFLISWSHWAISYLNAPAVASELEPFLGHDNAVPSQVAAGSQEDNWVRDSGTQASNSKQIPVSKPEPHSPGASRLYIYIYHEVDKWE